MKGFSDVCRAATCASGVILESWPARSVPESVVAKRRDSVTLRAAKPYGMTSVWGVRTVNTSILSSPKVSVGDLSFCKRATTTNNRFPNPAGRPILGNDNNNNGRARITTLRDDGLTTSGRTANAGFTLIELLVVVLIIGILAGVALPQYETAVLKSKMNSIVPLVRAIKNANEVYYMANGKYTDNLNDLDISIPAGNSKSIPTAGRVEYDNGTWIDQYVGNDCHGDLSCPRVWGGFGGRNDANKAQPYCVVAFYYDNTTTPGRIQCSGTHSKCAKICKGMNL